MSWTGSGGLLMRQWAMNQVLESLINQRVYSARVGSGLDHCQALEAVAVAAGFCSWQAMAEFIENRDNELELIDAIEPH
jgi:hypothetical protein